MEERIIKEINALLTQLFSKIKEAGYEWDAAKKELKQLEPNSDWSEEDEKMVKCCEIALEFFENLGKNSQGFPHENYFELNERIYPSEVNRWLKSLKERVQPQTKQELNEDTQQWIDAIIKDYEEWYKVNKDHSATIQIKINILKSLKERYTWKPSDEQMNNK